MDVNHIKKMTVIFHILSNPNRLQVLYLCLDEALSVGELVGSLQSSQSLVSHHLKHLRNANLIQATRRGKNMLYQVKDRRVQCILKDMQSHINGIIKKEGKK